MKHDWNVDTSVTVIDSSSNSIRMKMYKHQFDFDILCSYERENGIKPYLHGINRSNDALCSDSCLLNRFRATGLQYFNTRFS